MAPTITAAMSLSQDHLSLSHKLRKPVVEKLRRERINSSIEQLKSLLCAEFLQQQPDSKLEKADVLEMTVTVLTRLQQQQQHGALGQGYSRCSQKVADFISKESLKSQSQRPLLLSSTERTLSTVHMWCNNDRSQGSALWRPW
ncbi:transcription factor HES-5-like [Boleophthalmus pectinirostris]|uniref:transcription factor HES-5-like n=1 Tax=Boleophthalmus pectinirostris TaxID=150288 RepID=UPI000A1C28C1|nr:transcription factor HES-5-like [Boleophthalmus pectinirostris]